MASVPEIAVIIATYNREEALLRLLGDLERQTYPIDRFRVLIADDGSTHDPGLALARKPPLLRFEVLRNDRVGPAVVRNRALERVSEPLVLFLNDDARACPDLLRHHGLPGRLQGPAYAMLGDFRFSDVLRLERCNRLLEDGGLVISTRGMQSGGTYSHRAFWTGNLSVPTELLWGVGGFDVRFPEPSHEDLELGYRLEEKHGLRVVFNVAAHCDHEHPQNPSRLYAQKRMGGRNFWRFYRKHRVSAELGSLLRGGELDMERVAAEFHRQSTLEPRMHRLLDLICQWLPESYGTFPREVELEPGLVIRLPADSEEALLQGLRAVCTQAELLGFLEAAVSEPE